MKTTDEQKHKSEFGVALVRARENKGKNRAQFAADIGATPNGVKKWEDGLSFPDPKWWRGIKDVAGLDPAEFKYPEQHIHQHQPTNSPAVNANHVGNLSISIDAPGHQVTLTDVELEVLTLFRKYGNPALLERCLGQLRQAEAIFK